MTTRHPHLVAIDRVARDRRKFVREWLPLDVPEFVAQVKALLARAETRLKRAETLEKKWRSKVQRYEKIAAKKAPP